MANSLWDKLNGKNKSKKSSYEISKATNIPEDKVKEIMNGERIVPHDRVDALVGAIQKDDFAEKQLKLLQIKKWVEETDLKQKRVSMGYATQKSLANALNIDNSVISRLEQKNINTIGDNFLIKYYDFINDDININIKKEEPKIAHERGIYKNKDVIKDIDANVAEQWYNDFDFKTYLKEKNITYADFASILGYSGRSTSLISNLANHNVNILTSGRTVILRAYAYVNGLVEAQNKPLDEQTNLDNEIIEEEPNVRIEIDGEPIINTTDIKQLSFDDYDGNTSATTLNNDNIISDEFAHYDTPTVAEETVEISAYKLDYMESTIKAQEEEIEKLKLQVSRYEKLIDMIER